MIVVVIVMYIITIFFDQVTLYKEGVKKDFYVSSVMCLISFIIAVLLAVKVPIFSPARPIENLVRFLLKKL